MALGRRLTASWAYHTREREILGSHTIRRLKWSLCLMGPVRIDDGAPVDAKSRLLKSPSA